RAVARVHPLHLARDETVGHVVGAGAAILLRQGDAEQAERAHLMEDLAVSFLLQIGLDHARQQLVLRIGARGVADRALVLGELVLEQKRVVPLECRALAVRLVLHGVAPLDVCAVRLRTATVTLAASSMAAWGLNRNIFTRRSMKRAARLPIVTIS